MIRRIPITGWLGAVLVAIATIFVVTVPDNAHHRPNHSGGPTTIVEPPPTTTTTTVLPPTTTTTTTTPPADEWPSVDNTGPTGQCTSTHTGLLVVSQPGTVIDGLCQSGTIVFTGSSDGSTIRNSRVTANPGAGDTEGIYFDNGATNITVDHNEIDCAGNGGGSNGLYQGYLTTSITASFNEIRRCENGITTGANATFTDNLIHLPDSNDVNHADGVQVYDGAHDLLFEHNYWHYPLSSSSFQYHTSAGAQNYNVVLRNNKLIGGAAVLRIPGDNPSCRFPNYCGPWTGNEVTGNRLDVTDPAREWFLCSGDPASIDVWGAETGTATDANVVNSTNAVIQRSDCV
jgi:hypothetical protein